MTIRGVAIVALVSTLIVAVRCSGQTPREPIAGTWPGYLDGERALPEAATALFEALD